MLYIAILKYNWKHATTSSSYRFPFPNTLFFRACFYSNTNEGRRCVGRRCYHGVRVLNASLFIFFHKLKITYAKCLCSLRYKCFRYIICFFQCNILFWKKRITSDFLIAYAYVVSIQCHSDWNAFDKNNFKYETDLIYNT